MILLPVPFQCKLLLLCTAEKEVKLANSISYTASIITKNNHYDVAFNMMTLHFFQSEMRVETELIHFWWIRMSCFYVVHISPLSTLHAVKKMHVGGSKFLFVSDNWSEVP